MNAISPMMPTNTQDAADFLKQLSNANRLSILCCLVDGEMSVSTINERIKLSQSALSQHLASLRKADVVRTRREAQTIYYRLNGDKAYRLIELLTQLFGPIR